MDRSTLIETLKNYKDKHQKEYSIARLGFFGSAARGEETDKSDIDIVIEQLNPDLFLLGNIKLDLEQLLKRRVDVVRLRKEMNSYLRKRIDQEAIYV